MPTTSTSDRIAIFIDVDNLITEISKTEVPLRLGSIIERIREEGQVVSMRAYGDWSQPHVSGYLNEFRDNIVEMTQLAASMYRKNTADIALAVDALEMTLQPAAPDTIVIISGDRDFVPLVQKIVRYGKKVVGMGVTEDSTSQLLANACNLFLFVDDILQAATGAPAEADEAAGRPEQAAPAQSQISVVRLPDPLPRRLRRAFTLLTKAVTACDRQGATPTGVAVTSRLQQMSSTFYPSRLGFGTFGDFARAAEQAGYVRILDQTGSDDIVFDPGFKVAADLLHEDVPEYDYSTPQEARRSYEHILRTYKHVELIPWDERRDIVAHVFEFLEDGPETLGQVVDDAVLYCASRCDWIYATTVERLVQTMCIARCFHSDDGVPKYENQSYRVTTAVSLEEGLFYINQTYLSGIRMALPQVKFTSEAVALLLFGEATDDTMQEASRLLAGLGISPDDGETEMGRALREAQSRADV